MSSGFAAPIGGRFLRARTLGHDSARERERTRLRRQLRATTLHALESIATSADTDAATMIDAADEAATDLRTFVTGLAAAEGGTATAALRRQVAAMLHDTAL